ncbi:helix-turn-helix domain-containing protein [Aliivibrio fischeri]|uniref:Transcriptional regulator n=1 Tax=Aliivibrio fischeri TaxID=668 RepID=A0A510UF74_ALIFS|nr:helix-turn-helix transcriptional regulator [Aliivibrio fischeri]GEK13196.1 transcriptional regulator [Aliivibrio fischeri]
MSLQKRLKSIMKEERYSQRSFAEAIGIPLRSLEDFLSERRVPRAAFVMKITNHPQFKKYTLWLMTGEVVPNSSQVCPSESIQKKYGIN